MQVKKNISQLKEMAEKIFFMSDFSNFGVDDFDDMDKLEQGNYMQIIREDLSNYLEINGISPESFGAEVGLSGNAIRNILNGVAKDVSMSNWIRIRNRIYLPTFTSRPRGK